MKVQYDRTMEVYKEELIRMIRNNSLEYGDFILSSGIRSSCYLDLRKITLSYCGIWYIVNLIEEFIAKTKLEFDALGGVCVGADPMVGACLYGASFMPRAGFLVRKSDKKHGKLDRVIGSLESGNRCLLLEDVVSTGKSLMEAVYAVESKGCFVTQILAVVDRNIGAKELFEKSNIPFNSLLTLGEILRKPKPKEAAPDTVPQLL